jgi:uncharacterized phosphosugar-binding protein
MTSRYTAAIRGVIDHLETAQMPLIEKAADIVVESLTHGGAIFCSEIGHSNQWDFLNRAGGLAALQSFTYNININAPVADCLKDRPREVAIDRDVENIRFAIQNGNLRSGDVMLIGSVSGKNKGPIELALQCQAIGMKVIGFTAMDYTQQVKPQHPSGKKLFEVCDVAIDDGAPYGDAAVDMAGYDFKLLPVSGVGNIISGWMLWEKVIEKMVAAGTPPSVFKSINREDGQEYYDKSRAEYNRRGF